MKFIWRGQEKQKSIKLLNRNIENISKIEDKKSSPARLWNHSYSLDPDRVEGIQEKLRIFNIQMSYYEVLKALATSPSFEMEIEFQDHRLTPLFRFDDFLKEEPENIVMWNNKPCLMRAEYDITFKVEGQGFSAHKFFLIGKCTFFKNMFSSKKNT